MSYARRTHHLVPEGAYQVLAKAGRMEAAGKEIIHFEIGQPDYDTFSNVSLAGIKAITQGKTRYTDPAGIPSLREAIAEDAARRRGIQIHPEEVIVSPGGKPNLFFPCCWSNPAMIVTNPVSYLRGNDRGRWCSGTGPAAGGKQLRRPGSVGKAHKTDKLIILNSPSNLRAASSVAIWSTSPRRPSVMTAG
jgi:aspartate/methionine/tyrosine aminotransferase